MDPIAAIHYAKDSTLAMLLAAQARGFDARSTWSSAICPCATASPAGDCGRSPCKPDPAGWFTSASRAWSLWGSSTAS